MKSPPMKYGTVSGSEKQVSCIGLGTMGHVLRPSDLSVIDSFYEAGGNCLDTARVYSYQDGDDSGQTEKGAGRRLKEYSDSLILGIGIFIAPNMIALYAQQ